MLIFLDEESARPSYSAGVCIILSAVAARIDWLIYDATQDLAVSSINQTTGEAQRSEAHNFGNFCIKKHDCWRLKGDRMEDRTT